MPGKYDILTHYKGAGNFRVAVVHGQCAIKTEQYLEAHSLDGDYHETVTDLYGDTWYAYAVETNTPLSESSTGARVLTPREYRAYFRGVNRHA